jgi:hypothetical protein
MTPFRRPSTLNTGSLAPSPSKASFLLSSAVGTGKILHNYNLSSLSDVVVYPPRPTESEEIGIPSPSDALAEVRRSLSCCSPGHPERARNCTELAKLLREQWVQTGNSALIDEALALDREALSLRPVGHSHRALSCYSLSYSLRRQFSIKCDEHLIHEALDLAREAIEVSTENCPERAQYCQGLSAVLQRQYELTSNANFLTMAVDWERKGLALRPNMGPDRASSCITLAMPLVTIFAASGDDDSLREGIDLNRQALGMLSEGHIDWILGHVNLSFALNLLYDNEGDQDVLSEAISLQRRTLNLTPNACVYYGQLCTNLSNSLTTLYFVTGEVTAAEEAIALERKSLSFHPVGHPERGASCTNLATSLALRYEKTGIEEYINEAISLSREAMQLYSVQHPFRAALCGNLAYALKTRFVRTGDQATLAEIIALEREAVSLCPIGHPDHGRWTSNLGGTFYLSEDPALRSEAIRLAFESLESLPPGHPFKVTVCLNLSAMTRKEFEANRQHKLLLKAIFFAEEALGGPDLQSPERTRAYENLGTLLMMNFDCTGDSKLLFGAKSALDEANIRTLPGALDRWEVYVQLARLNMYHQGPCFDVKSAINLLDDAVRMDADDPQALLSKVVEIIQLIRSCDDIEEVQESLLSLYEAVIDLMSFAAALAFEEHTQLGALAKCGRTAADAFSLAVRVGDILTGLQLLEHARGIIWSQALNFRDPQLSQVPPQYAEELSTLLRSISKTKAVPTLLDTSKVPGGLTARDIRYQQISRIQQLVQELRLLPELENLMRGATAEELIKVAEVHPVVVLVASSGYCHALIIRSSDELLESFILEDIGLKELKTLTLSCRSTNIRGSTQPSHRGLRVSRHNRHSTTPVLDKLWRAVVKPIITRLKLKVRVSLPPLFPH